MRLLLVLIFGLFLSACSDDPTKSDPYASWSAKDFYDESRRALNAGEFQTAIDHLESLEARFPFSPYSRQAQLDVAYAYYKFEEMDSAIAAADRFLRLNPRDDHADYAWYLKGLANFNRGSSFLDSWFPRNLAQHDSKSMNDAFNDFSTLIRRYPDSQYAGDAYKRLVYLRNEMAEQEIIVAEHYLKRGAWVAAANRAQYTLERYPQAPARDRALEIMETAYASLNMPELAADARQVIQANAVEPSTTNLASQQDALPPQPVN